MLARRGYGAELGRWPQGRQGVCRSAADGQCSAIISMYCMQQRKRCRHAAEQLGCSGSGRRVDVVVVVVVVGVAVVLGAVSSLSWWMLVWQRTARAANISCLHSRPLYDATAVVVGWLGVSWRRGGVD